MYTFLGKQTPQNRKAIPFRQRRERFTRVCEQSAARRPHFASKSLYQKKRLRQKPQSVFYCISLFPLCGTPPPRTLLCRSPGSGINALVCLPDLQWHFRQRSSITVAGPRRTLTCFPLSFPKQEEHKTTLFSYSYYITTLFFCQSGKCPARKSLHRNQHTPTLEHGCQSKISVLQQPCRQNIAGCS